MRAGARKESVESRGATSWNDGVYSFDGGSTREVPGILSKAESTGAESGTTIGGDGDGVQKTPWFDPVEIQDCPGGVCPVPWATKEERPELEPDLINHPSHYQDQGGVECIDAIEAQLTDEAFEGYIHGNCVKYLWRWKNKGGVQDLKKCRWYLDRLIAQQEN